MYPTLLIPIKVYEPVNPFRVHFLPKVVHTQPAPSRTIQVIPISMAASLMQNHFFLNHAGAGLRLPSDPLRPNYTYRFHHASLNAPLVQAQFPPLAVRYLYAQKVNAPDSVVELDL